MDTMTTSGKLPTPERHHLLTHDVRPIDLNELTMNFNSRNALRIQELNHRPGLAGCGRRNKIFQFGPLLPSYWHKAGPFRLAYDSCVIDLLRMGN
ncbi:hypothetical protein TNCV_1686831 [Trichonephila clavipes]|nr:hypothetical protein TNCV_1686831 [Trichonephila clavipes]